MKIQRKKLANPLREGEGLFNNDRTLVKGYYLRKSFCNFEQVLIFSGGILHLAQFVGLEK
jgi:hypothetical protein